MSTESQISFGDNVRVRSTPQTESLGLAGLVGQVRGETTPSVTGIKAVGDLSEDYAVNVFFESRKEDYWFAPELLEFIDHAPGTEITLEGVPKKWTRNEAGEWIETYLADVRVKNKPWWKFW